MDPLQQKTLLEQQTAARKDSEPSVLTEGGAKQSLPHWKLGDLKPKIVAKPFVEDFKVRISRLAPADQKKVIDAAIDLLKNGDDEDDT